MAKASQGTKVEIGTGSGDPITTMTATVGYPTILTKTAHGLSNGDVGVLSAFAGADAALMNDMTVIVKNVTDNTFAVDIDTTGGTLTAELGTITPVALTEISEVVDVGREAGERSEIDTTHLRSTAKEFLLGLKDSGNLSISMNWLFDDLGQLAAIDAEGEDDASSFKITYPDGETASFQGFVKSVSGPSAGVDGKLEGSISVKITGEVTFA